MTAIFIVFGSEARAATDAGGKGRALAVLQRAGLPVPPWFAVTPEALVASLREPDSPASPRSPDSPHSPYRPSGDPSIKASMSDGVALEIDAAIGVLCPGGELVAVRSSATDEDGSQHSFAGQLESYLFVAPEHVRAKVEAVWRSGFSERVVAYRRERGLPARPAAPAVIVQRMVNARVSGVAFGADPVTGRRGMAIVNAVFGLGTALVSGESDADVYGVDRAGAIVRRDIAIKRTAHRADPSALEGVSPADVPAHLGSSPALSDGEVLAVAELARRAGQVFGRPQDIEWAIEGHRIFLLQARPITSLSGLPDPDGVTLLWDNSNIIESYSGITTPLTFSFARTVYEGVYRQFATLMRVPRATVAAHDRIFANMLGLIRGRVYYNLLNWYRVLAMLPGFALNRKFMEQMMGVREGLPPSLEAELGAGGFAARGWDAVRLTGTLGGLAVNYRRHPRSIDAFYARLGSALAAPDPPLEVLRADELAARYYDLRRRLLTKWDAPLVNDFFAMIFYGLLRRLTERWCGDADGTLQNDLVSGEGGMISAEPAVRIREMARSAAGHPSLVDALCAGTLDEIRATCPAAEGFQAQFESYLAVFGERCMDELKLESATLHDDPLPLLRAVGQLVKAGRLEADPAGLAACRPRAERRVADALRGRPLRRWIFGWVLRNARARVRDRENLRFERTRLFGRVRRIFVEIGRRFFADGILDDARDIFFLEVGEILGCIEGSTSSTLLRPLVAVRKAEFDAFRSMPLPDERFETQGVVHQGNEFRSAAATIADTGGDERRGTGCCPGIVRGRVQVVTDPRGVSLKGRAILVAERTDPGWIMIFPAAAGILVERGSLLSHSAIVARELGIPAVVAIPGLTRWLADGEWVEFDGSTGVVRKIAPPADMTALAGDAHASPLTGP